MATRSYPWSRAARSRGLRRRRRAPLRSATSPPCRWLSTSLEATTAWRCCALSPPPSTSWPPPAVPRLATAACSHGGQHQPLAAHRCGLLLHPGPRHAGPLAAASQSEPLLATTPHDAIAMHKCRSQKPLHRPSPPASATAGAERRLASSPPAKQRRCRAPSVSLHQAVSVMLNRRASTSRGATPCSTSTAPLHRRPRPCHHP